MFSMLTYGKSLSNYLDELMPNEEGMLKMMQTAMTQGGPPGGPAPF